MGAALPHATPVSAATVRSFTPASRLCPQVITQSAGRLRIANDCSIMIEVVAAPERHGDLNPYVCPSLGVRPGIRPRSHAHAANTHARQAIAVCSVRPTEQGSAPERHLEPVTPLVHLLPVHAR
jgi:hypothetical protein